MAVAVGMVMMTKASEKHGLTEAGTAYKIEEVCATYGLPTTDDASLEKLPRRLRQTRKLRDRQSMLFCLRKSAQALPRRLQSPICSTSSHRNTVNIF